MMIIEELKHSDVGRWVAYTAPHGEISLGRIKSWNEKYIFVVYHCADEWDNFRNYTAAATNPGEIRVYLTSKILESLPKREVFATGFLPDSPAGLFMTGSGKEMRWVAETGEIGDWTIYCHWSYHDALWVRDYGDKVCRKEHIKKCIHFEEDAVFSRFRY